MIVKGSHDIFEVCLVFRHFVQEPLKHLYEREQMTRNGPRDKRRALRSMIGFKPTFKENFIGNDLAAKEAPNLGFPGWRFPSLPMFGTLQLLCREGQISPAVFLETCSIESIAKMV